MVESVRVKKSTKRRLFLWCEHSFNWNKMLWEKDDAFSTLFKLEWGDQKE